MAKRKTLIERWSEDKDPVGWDDDDEDEEFDGEIDHEKLGIKEISKEELNKLLSE